MAMVRNAGSSYEWSAHQGRPTQDEMRVKRDMDPIDSTQIPEPGLVVPDLTTHDEATARTVMAVLEQTWATSGITPVRREAGVPGFRARVHADIRRPAGLQPAPSADE